MSTLKRVPLESLFNQYAKAFDLVDPTLVSFLKDIVGYLSDRDLNLLTILNQGINFPDNFAGKILSFTTNGAPNTQDTVSHGLGRIPTYFIVIDKDKAGDVYKSAAFDGTNVYLKTSVASVTVSILIF